MHSSKFRFQVPVPVSLYRFLVVAKKCNAVYSFNVVKEQNNTM
jgi:hypothetical protein